MGNTVKAVLIKLEKIKYALKFFLIEVDSMDAKITHGEKFYNIIKKIGFSNNSEKFSAKNFEYLFSIPETEEFFKWFLNGTKISLSFSFPTSEGES